MGQNFYLTEQDRSELQELFTQWASERLNPANRAPATPDDYPATGCYVAYCPDGIDGLILTSGTGTAIDAEPGSAQCQIFRMLDFTGTPRLYPIGTSDLTVLNVSTVAVAVGSWAIIVQDKFNDWYVTGGGGGSPTAGDQIRKVRPIGELGPINIDFSGSGTGTGADEDTFIWDGQIVDVGQVPPELGFVTPVRQIYIIQKTITGPEPKRELALNGIYLGDYIGIGLLRPFHTMDFRPVYVVCAAPIATILQKVVTDITGATSVCNGDKTVTTTIAFLTKEIAIPLQ